MSTPYDDLNWRYPKGGDQGGNMPYDPRDFGGGTETYDPEEGGGKGWDFPDQSTGGYTGGHGHANTQYGGNAGYNTLMNRLSDYYNNIPSNIYSRADLGRLGSMAAGSFNDYLAQAAVRRGSFVQGGAAYATAQQERGAQAYDKYRDMRGQEFRDVNTAKSNALSLMNTLYLGNRGYDVTLFEGAANRKFAGSQAGKDRSASFWDNMLGIGTTVLGGVGGYLLSGGNPLGAYYGAQVGGNIGNRS